MTSTAAVSVGQRKWADEQTGTQCQTKTLLFYVLMQAYGACSITNISQPHDEQFQGVMRWRDEHQTTVHGMATAYQLLPQLELGQTSL